jgi:hypothetical protein
MSFSVEHVFVQADKIGREKIKEKYLSVSVGQKHCICGMTPVGNAL